MNLQRFLEPPPPTPVGERCDLCREPLTPDHGHVVDVASRRLMCACQGCYLLFPPEATGRIRGVGRRYRHGEPGLLDAAWWEEARIPVGVAFFFYNSVQGRVVACYPGPAGATESLLELPTWEAVVRAHPFVAEMLPDVEALLIRRLTARGLPAADGAPTFDCFLVPIDACYELVGRMRRHWKGFDGGAEAWREIDAFFAGLCARCPEMEAAGG